MYCVLKVIILYQIIKMKGGIPVLHGFVLINIIYLQNRTVFSVLNCLLTYSYGLTKNRELLI